MKPFDFKAAKAGKPVLTRGGRKARIICFDAVNPRPIVALVALSDGGEVALEYYKDGTRSGQPDVKSDNDLFMAGQRHVGWVNVWRLMGGVYETGENIYATEEDAKETKGKMLEGTSRRHAATLKIEWED